MSDIQNPESRTTAVATPDFATATRGVPLPCPGIQKVVRTRRHRDSSSCICSSAQTSAGTRFPSTRRRRTRYFPGLVRRLQGLKAEHKVGTGVSSALPVVRTHLVTGEKCLVVNPLCPSLLDQISFPVPHAENMVSLASNTTNVIGFEKEDKRYSAQVPLRASRLFPTISGSGSVGRPRTLSSSLM